MLRRAPRALVALSVTPPRTCEKARQGIFLASAGRRRGRGRSGPEEAREPGGSTDSPAHARESACARCACPCALMRSCPAWLGGTGRRRVRAVATRTLRVRTPARRRPRRRVGWPTGAVPEGGTGCAPRFEDPLRAIPARRKNGAKGPLRRRDARCTGQPALPTALASCMLPQSASRALRRSGRWRSGAVPLGVKGWKDDSRTSARQQPGTAAHDHRRRALVLDGRRTQVHSPARQPLPEAAHVPLGRVVKVPPVWRRLARPPGGRRYFHHTT